MLLDGQVVLDEQNGDDAGSSEADQHESVQHETFCSGFTVPVIQNPDVLGLILRLLLHCDAEMVLTVMQRLERLLVPSTLNQSYACKVKTDVKTRKNMMLPENL